MPLSTGASPVGTQAGNGQQHLWYTRSHACGEPVLPAGWGEGQGWMWGQPGMCQLWDMDEAPGPAVTRTVWTCSPCLQDVPIGGITSMPVLAWGCKGRRNEPCHDPSLGQTRSRFSSPPPVQGRPAPAPTGSVASADLASVQDVFLALGSLKWNVVCRVCGGELLHWAIPALLPTQPRTCWPPSPHGTVAASISARTQRSPAAGSAQAAQADRALGISALCWPCRRP